MQLILLTPSLVLTFLVVISMRLVFSSIIYCPHAPPPYIHHTSTPVWLFFFGGGVVLGLRCCVQAFSSCSQQRLLFIVVYGPLIAVASLAAEYGLWVHKASVASAHRLSSCGAPAQLLHGIWNLPRSGIEPASPALAGRLLSTLPPGESSVFHLRSWDRKEYEREFPGIPVARTQTFHFTEHRFNPGWGTKIPHGTRPKKGRKKRACVHFVCFPLSRKMSSEASQTKLMPPCAWPERENPHPPISFNHSR